MVPLGETVLTSDANDIFVPPVLEGILIRVGHLLFSQSLGYPHFRPLGCKYCFPWVCSRFSVSNPREDGSDQLPSSREASDARGIYQGIPPKESSEKGVGVYFTSFSSAKAFKGVENDHRITIPQLLHQKNNVSYRNYTFFSGYSRARRSNGYLGSEGGLFSYSHLQSSQDILKNRCVARRTSVSSTVHLPTVWDLLCPFTKVVLAVAAVLRL